MGIFVKGGEPNNIYKGVIPVLAVYVLGSKVWPTGVLSCYSNGYWIDEHPWTDNTPWTD